MRKVWMDCDTGFDDLLALLVIAGDPKIKLLGISTVVGNTTLDSTTANTLAAAEFLAVDAPVYRGAVHRCPCRACHRAPRNRRESIQQRKRL